MKHFIIVLCTAIVLFCSSDLFAQDKQKVGIEAVKLSNTTVNFTVTSDKPFYIGDNAFVLYIGTKHFHLSKQSNDETGKGSLTFFISADDFNTFSNGDQMYLNYGFMSDEQTLQMDQLSKDKISKCWSLGSFNKTLLSK